ncbi:MAG TPA: hypothetical protein VN915_17790, partial [Elusimicrobiota bacterium]|nr:hypothetical protein [Elusimicrobiota bacterium]
MSAPRYDKRAASDAAVIAACVMTILARPSAASLPCGQLPSGAQQQCQATSANLDDFTKKRQTLLGALGKDPSGGDPATVAAVADYLKSKNLAVSSFNSLLDQVPGNMDVMTFNPAVDGFTSITQKRIDALPPEAREAAQQLAQSGVPAPKKEPGPNVPATEGAGNGATPAGTSPAKENPQTTAGLTAAQTALKGGNTGAALNSLDKVLAQDPGNAAALAMRAQAKLAQGDRAGALADARQAFALDPKDHMSQAMVSELEQLGQAARKIGGAKLDFGAERAPEDAPGRGGAGQAGLQGWGAGRTASPGALAAGAAGAPGTQAEGDGLLVFGPLLQMALHKEAVGDDTGALIDVSQAIDADPKDAAAWTLRAELDLRLGNSAAAITDASRAIGLTPTARALRARSYAEYETKLYRQALADAVRAV